MANPTDPARAAAEAILGKSFHTMRKLNEFTDLIQRLAIGPAVEAARREGAEAMREAVITQHHKFAEELMSMADDALDSAFPEREEWYASSARTMNGNAGIIRALPLPDAPGESDRHIVPRKGVLGFDGERVFDLTAQNNTMLGLLERYSVCMNPHEGFVIDSEIDAFLATLVAAEEK
jgi:hypothetical protein